MNALQKWLMAMGNKGLGQAKYKPGYMQKFLANADDIERAAMSQGPASPNQLSGAFDQLSDLNARGISEGLEYPGDNKLKQLARWLATRGQ